MGVQIRPVHAVSQLQSLLRDLGLERRVKAVPDLTAYLAAKEV
jgi:hypothetical protein